MCLSLLLKNKSSAPILQTFQKFSIYIVVILFFFSQSIFSSSKTSGFYQKICRIQYDQSKPGVDCTDLNSFPSQQKSIQKIASQWNFYNTVASLLTSVPATLIWSAWGDLHGRKLPLLMPMVGTALYNLVFIIFLSTDVSQLWIVTITSVIFNVFGGKSLVIVVMLQVVADICTNKKYLVAQFGMAYGMLAIGSIIGSTVGGKTLKSIGFAKTFLIAQAGLVATASFIEVGFAETNVAKDNDAPGVGAGERKGVLEHIVHRINSATPTPAVSKSTFSKLIDIIQSIFSLLKDVVKTYTKPRTEHRRLFLILVFMIFVLANTANEEFSSALNLFVFVEPLTFSAADFSKFNGFYIAMQVIGSIAVSIVFKYAFGVRDTGMVLISVASLLAMLIIIGLSTHNWMIWLGGVIGSCQGLLVPSVNAFVARAVDTDEMGKILAGNNVASNLADVISTLVYSQLYSLTVDWFPGFAFLLGAGLCGLALIVALGLHIGARIHMKTVEQPSLRSFIKRGRTETAGNDDDAENRGHISPINVGGANERQYGSVQPSAEL